MSPKAKKKAGISRSELARLESLPVEALRKVLRRKLKRMKTTSQIAQAIRDIRFYAATGKIQII